MSNKTQLQTNNTKYASLIETLRGKAVSSAEDLDTELTTQEGLISQLSTILDSKASGGSGGGDVVISTFTCSSLDYYDTESNSYTNSFLEGWTWQDFIDSPLNHERVTGPINYAIWQSYRINGSFIQMYNDMGLPVYVSIDGTMAGRVLINDAIQSRDYGIYASAGGH